MKTHSEVRLRGEKSACGILVNLLPSIDLHIQKREGKNKKGGKKKERGKKKKEEEEKKKKKNMII